MKYSCAVPFNFPVWTDSQSSAISSQYGKLRLQVITTSESYILVLNDHKSVLAMYRIIRKCTVGCYFEIMKFKKITWPRLYFMQLYLLRENYYLCKTASGLIVLK